MGTWSDALSGVVHAAEHSVAAKMDEIRKDPVAAAKHAAVGAYNLVIGDDIHTLRDKHASFGEKALAVVSIASNFVGPEGKLLTKAAELGVKAVVEHVGEHVIERAVGSLEKTVGHEAVSAVTHAAEKALPHVKEALVRAGEAAEASIKAVNTTHNVVVAATGLPDHVHRAYDDVKAMANPHLTAAERIKAAETFARDATHAVTDVAVIAKGTREGAHGAHTVATHVESAAENARHAAASAERHAAAAATSVAGHASSAAQSVTKRVATAAEAAVTHAGAAVHNVTKYVAHAANDTVRATEHVVRDTAHRVASTVEGAALAAHLPSAAAAVRGAEHRLDTAAKHVAGSATSAIEHGEHAANAEIAHATKSAGTAIHGAEHAALAAANDAARATKTALAGARRDHEPARATGTAEPHTALERAAETARHVGKDVKETVSRLVDPLVAKVDHFKEEAAGVKKHVLDAADTVAHGQATRLADVVTKGAEALHERKENTEARESVAAALEKISPEARERAEKSGFAQVGIPHVQAKPYDGRGTQSGTVTSVIGDRVEQYTGRGQWSTYAREDLKVLTKALKENAELHSENRPTRIHEGDKLEVSSGRITLTPADHSKQSISVSIDPGGHALAAQPPAYTPQAPQQPHQAAGRA